VYRMSLRSMPDSVAAHNARGNTRTAFPHFRHLRFTCRTSSLWWLWPLMEPGLFSSKTVWFASVAGEVTEVAVDHGQDDAYSTVAATSTQPAPPDQPDSSGRRHRPDRTPPFCGSGFPLTSSAPTAW